MSINQSTFGLTLVSLVSVNGKDVKKLDIIPVMLEQQIPISTLISC